MPTPGRGWPLTKPDKPIPAIVGRAQDGIMRIQRVEGSLDVIRVQTWNVAADDHNRLAGMRVYDPGHPCTQVPLSLRDTGDAGGPEAATSGEPIRRNRQANIDALQRAQLGDQARGLALIESPGGEIANIGRQPPLDCPNLGRPDKDDHMPGRAHVQLQW